MDALIVVLEKVPAVGFKNIDNQTYTLVLLAQVLNIIKQQPTIERKTGEWIVMETAYEDTEAKCSECGFTTLVNEPGNGLHMLSDLNYCSNCGAKMKKPMTIPEEIINSVLGYDD